MNGIFATSSSQSVRDLAIFDGFSFIIYLNLFRSMWQHIEGDWLQMWKERLGNFEHIRFILSIDCLRHYLHGEGLALFAEISPCRSYPVANSSLFIWQED